MSTPKKKTPAPAPKKRVYTDAQLAAKRERDRIYHARKRAEARAAKSASAKKGGKPTAKPTAASHAPSFFLHPPVLNPHAPASPLLARLIAAATAFIDAVRSPAKKGKKQDKKGAPPKTVAILEFCTIPLNPKKVTITPAAKGKPNAKRAAAALKPKRK